MADNFDYGEAVRLATEDDRRRQEQKIAEAVQAGVTKWFKTATPEQIHELIFEPYEAFKKENR